MIEINLLPGGGGRKAKSRGGGGGIRIDLKGMLAGIAGRFTDKFLLAAVASSAVAALAIGMLYSRQTYRAVTLAAAEEQAIKDSTRLAIALAEKIKAEAIRDTALRQINIIKSIDDDRFIWPHVLDELSRALTPYTWLTTITYAGNPQGTVNVTAAAAGSGKAKVDTTVVREEINLRILGQTVDIQALTRFMRQLEASPFVANVRLEKSEMVLEGNKEVMQFTLLAIYTRPDPAILRRVPLTITGSLASTGGN
ncbi:MAG: PilN domain-containing protein [Gemmatimonadota bacterium]|nr:PilN domain-containing protein [Gemmatimonadota bacterium]